MGERLRHIPELFEQHLEDLAFLWGQRRAALVSPEHTLRQVADLAERIEAHLQGLAVPEPAEVRAQLEPRLAMGDRDETCAAACALLRVPERSATQAVLAAFVQAEGEPLTGLRDALGFCNPARFVPDLQALLASAEAPAPTLAATAVVLANHRLLDPGDRVLRGLLAHDTPAVARQAWQAAGRAAAQRAPGAEPPSLTPALPAALAHADAGVRRAAWQAAAWAGEPSLLPLLRQRCAQGDTEALTALAALGGGDDFALLRQAVLALPDGPSRCAVLARYGHPLGLNALLRWMDPADLATAAAAGEAFEGITGVDLRAGRRTLPVAEGADDFEREMAPEVWVPDAARAVEWHAQHAGRLEAGPRWRRGLRVDGAVSRDTLVQLDLQARWDAAMRAALQGQVLSAPPPLL